MEKVKIAGKSNKMIPTIYDMEKIKKLEILTTSELLERGIEPFNDYGPWIHITFKDKGDIITSETATFSSTAWYIEFI